MSDFATAATRYAERGWFVFPCVQGGKTPLTPSGHKDASTDPAQIAEWAEVFPNANIGIATGASNLVVLDVDVKDNGIASLKSLLKEHPEIRDTYLVKTASGGMHYYYQADEQTVRNSARKLAPGLDIRGDGGYVIAPPSVGANGEKYVWERADKLSHVPQALREKLSVYTANVKVYDDDEPIPDGQRNDAIFRLACSLRSKGLAEAELLAATSAINQRRCKPPLGDTELQKCVSQACTYPPGEVWQKFLEYDQKKAEAREKKIARNGREDERRRGLPTDAQGRQVFPIKKYSQIEREWVDWLMPGYIPLGKFSLCWGLEGRGKSFASLAIAAAVSQGTPLPGALNLATKPANVLLLTYEDDPGDTIRGRLQDCGADLERVYTVHYNDYLVRYDDLSALEATIEKIEAESGPVKLIVIDPVVSFCSGVDEKNEGSVREAFEPMVRLAARKKIAIVGIKHANKREDVSWANRISGSRAWTALARSVFVVGHDNEKQSQEEQTYGGMIPTKGNLGGKRSPLTFEINNGVFRFTGSDPLLTEERLFPKPPDKKKSN